MPRQEKLNWQNRACHDMKSRIGRTGQVHWSEGDQEPCSQVESEFDNKLNTTTHSYGCGECETSTGDHPRGRQGRKSKKREDETSYGKAVSPESPSATTARGEPAAAFGDSNPPTLESSDIVVDKVKGQPTKRRSGRKAKPNLNKLLRAMMAEIAPLTSSNIEGEIKCYQAMFPNETFEFDDPLLVYNSVSDPDTSNFLRQ